MKKHIFYIILLFLLLLLASCESTAIYTSGTGSPVDRKPVDRNASNIKGNSGKKGKTEYFNTSWIGNQKHGRDTASGEIFNMYDLVAAHKNLPFGSSIKLINEANNTEVIIRINDRITGNTDSDLVVSYKVAEILDIDNNNTNSKLKALYMN